MFDDLENRFASHINPDDIVPVGQHIEDQTEKMDQIIERLDRMERDQKKDSIITCVLIIVQIILAILALLSPYLISLLRG